MSGIVARTFLPSEDLQPLVVTRSIPTAQSAGGSYPSPAAPGAPSLYPTGPVATPWVNQETIPGLKNSTLLLAAALGIGLFLMSRQAKQVIA